MFPKALRPSKDTTPSPNNKQGRKKTLRAMAAGVVAALSIGLIAPTALAAPPSSGKFSAPLDSKSYRLTSAFGPRCQPIMFASTHHNGQDMGASAGTPIYAMTDGVVVRAQADRTAGQWILIKHTIDGQTYHTSLSHTLDADKFVKVGQKVKKGQKVAEVGSTGVSTGPHLHFEIWRGNWNTGTPIDPDPFLKARGINLKTHASSIPQRPAPSSCTYYAHGNTSIYASPSPTAQLRTVVPHGTVMKNKPAQKKNGFIPVTVSGVSGWAHEANVSPSKSKNPGGAGFTTASVNMRSGPGTQHKVITTLGYAARINDVVSSSGNWYQVKAAGKTGWVSSDYLNLSIPKNSFGFFLADSFTANANNVFSYGRFDDDFFVGDWNGDGKDTLAFRRGNTFHIRNSNSTGAPTKKINYGRPGDVILVGDWNNDGVDTFAVRRGRDYHIKNSVAGGPADHVITYGKPKDSVMVGDWNGDGRDTLAVRRGKVYHVKNRIAGGDADQVIAYGKAKDDVYVGDWDGNRKDTFAVRRGKVYHIKNSMSGGDADIVQSYGRANDVTIVGDWNGDGKDTLGIHRVP